MDDIVATVAQHPAALVDLLRASPDAVVQLVQSLKAASGVPQNDPALAACAGLVQAPAPAPADASIKPAAEAPAGATFSAASLQAPAAGSNLAALQQAQQGRQQALAPVGNPQLAGTGYGSSHPQQHTDSGKVATAQAAAQLKHMLLGLLQPAQQTPQQQQQQPSAAELCWGAPSPLSNNSATVPQHAILPAPGMQALQDHLQQPQAHGDLVQHLRASLFDILKSTMQQQPQAATQAAPVSQHTAAVPAQFDAAALAAAMALDITLASPAPCSGSAASAAVPAPVARRPAAAAVRSSAAPSFPPAATNGFAVSDQQAQQQQQQAQQQQAAGSSMPHLLDRLRAAVVSSTAPKDGSTSGRIPEQQRLLSIVDQLQAAWASLGKGGMSAGASGAGADDPAAMAAGSGPHDAVAAAAAAVEAKADADGMPDASGLYMLLEAVQQQVADAAAANGPGRNAAGSAAADAEYPGAAMMHDGSYAAMDGAMYAAMNGQHATAGWGDSYGYGSAAEEYAHEHEQQQQAGSGRRKRSWDSEQQQAQSAAAGSNGLAGVVAAMMREEGMPVLDGADPVVEQKWLLKPRGRGKRQVKPNKVALTGELPPVFDRWAGKSRSRRGEGRNGAAGAESSDEDELWKPPRVRTSSKRRRTQGSEDGAGVSEGQQDNDQRNGAAGAAGRRKGSGAASRRGYGWQLLQQEQQQQDQAHSPGEDANGAAADEEGAGADATEGAEGSFSDNGMDGAAGDATGDAGSADGGSEGGTASASAATGKGQVTKTRTKPAPRKDRWVPPTEEWTSDDGLKVWPKDTQICAGARVFYVAYKFVEDFWPNNLDTPDNHITAHPIRFYLDGQDTGVELTAKLRLYRKAVHLVISPYSALAKKFVRKWLAGYTFDPDAQLLRAYLSTLKPKPPKVPDVEPDPEQLTAAAAAAAEWCNTAAAQFASGTVAVDAQQQLAAQLAALASLLQPKAGKGGGKDGKRAAVQLPLKLPQLLPALQQQQQPGEEQQHDAEQQEQQGEGAQAMQMDASAPQEAVQHPAAAGPATAADGGQQEPSQQPDAAQPPQAAAAQASSTADGLLAQQPGAAGQEQEQGQPVGAVLGGQQPGVVPATVC